jgi:3-dehydroquinate synthase
MAQVDCSVGGKTAINLPYGKNLVGAFKQPAMVITDCALLKTLDAREWSGGFAEVIKYAVISSKELFDTLSSREVDDKLIDIIYACCDMKRRLVETDQFDQNQRMLLNFGHTFGHAIEAERGIGAMLHGEAVALGIVLAFRLSSELGICPATDTERVASHFSSCGLPTRLADVGLSKRGMQLTRWIGRDKKNSAGRCALVLARGIGRASKESDDIKRAQDNVDVARKALEDLDAQIAEETAGIAARFDADASNIESASLAPKRGGILVQSVALGWRAGTS